MSYLKDVVYFCLKVYLILFVEDIKQCVGERSKNRSTLPDAEDLSVLRLVVGH